MQIDWPLAIIGAFIFALASYALARWRDVPGGIWFFNGLLLGPFGLLTTYFWAKPSSDDPADLPPSLPVETTAAPPPVAAPVARSGFCPQCGTPRVGAFRYCQSCRFDFDSAPASVVAPAAPQPPTLSTMSGNPYQGMASTTVETARQSPVRFAIVLIFILLLLGGYYLATRNGPGTIDAVNAPDIGQIWFGTSYDPTTFALANRSDGQSAAGQVAYVAHLNRASRGEIVSTQITTEAGPLTFGSGNLTSGSVFMAGLLPALGSPGTYEVRIIDSGGNILASDPLTVR